MLEVLVAIVILGMVVGAVMGGLSLAIGLSTRTTSRAKVDALSLAAADRLASAPYVACPTNSGAGSYESAVQAATSTVDWPNSAVQITRIEFWQPTSSDAGTWNTANGLSPGECASPASLTTSRILQRVTLLVQSPDGRYSRVTEVVKTHAFAPT
jgi:type II secretory pathway pseudopilin PulG